MPYFLREFIRKTRPTELMVILYMQIQYNLTRAEQNKDARPPTLYGTMDHISMKLHRSNVAV